MRKVVKVEALSEFDQGTSATDLSFRTNAYPAMTWDDRGRLYLAWTERGFSPADGRPSSVDGDAKIVMSSSFAGLFWTSPRVVSEQRDENGQVIPGHQFMPSLTFAGGKLMLVYYDLREDVSGFRRSSSTTRPPRKRAASATRWISAPRWGHRGSLPCSPGPFGCPITSSAGGPSGCLPRRSSCRAASVSWRCASSSSSTRRTCRCSSWARCPSSATTSTSRRRRRSCRSGGADGPTTRRGTSVPMFHAVWSDNRDVRPPVGGDWTKYTPPDYCVDPTDPSTCTPGARTSVYDPTKQVTACDGDECDRARATRTSTRHALPGACSSVHQVTRNRSAPRSSAASSCSRRT